MKGQWIGYYHGSAEGRVMINVDEVDDHYEGAAYLNPTTRCIPATVAYLSTINKDHEQVATAYMIIFLELANMIQAREHSRFFVTVCVIEAKQRCQGLILLYVSLKHDRSLKKPGMHLDQPHKGMKAARDVASLSPAGGGLRGWNCLRSVGKKVKFVFIIKG